jgi:hypothetical protein
MFRYKLRTLLIVLALGPPVMAILWFAYQPSKQPIGTFPIARSGMDLIREDGNTDLAEAYINPGRSGPVPIVERRQPTGKVRFRLRSLP